MNQFKRAHVLMLSTQESKLQLSNINGVLIYSDDIRIKEHTTSQHLYIISDDEIKEYDYYLNENNIVFKSTGRLNKEAFIHCKKIIATTDTSLGYNESFINPIDNKADNKWISLPQPSQQFIENYIQAYNKGEVITDVLVEYEEYNHHHINYNPDGRSIRSASSTWITRLKVNPKDNTITIKRLKDNWNRREVIKLLNNLNNTLNIGSSLTLEQWIEKNL